MKIKHTIGGILIALGILFIFGAVGNLDYLDECGISYGGAELFEVLLRCLGGFAGIALGGFLCCDVEVLNDEKENREDWQ